MPRTPGAKNLKTRQREALKGAPSAPAPKAVPSSAASAAPIPPASPSNTSIVKNLAASILAAREGDPSKAKKPTPKGPAPETPGKDTTVKDVKKKAKTPAEEADPEIADTLAGVLADGEASLGAMLVPPDKEDKVQKLGSRMLKYAWKYHFIQNGVNGFPSWAVLLIAHLGFAASLIAPNKERVMGWWDDLLGKIKPQEGQHKVPASAPTQHAATIMPLAGAPVPPPQTKDANGDVLPSLDTLKQAGPLEVMV